MVPQIQGEGAREIRLSDKYYLLLTIVSQYQGFDVQ